MFRTFFLSVMFLMTSTTSWSAGITPSIIIPGNLNNSLPDNVATEAVKTFGIYFAHRPYQGAISMFEVNSVDVKLEVTMMKIGDGYFNAMRSNGFSFDQGVIALPSGKINLRKALNPGMDIGVSGILYRGQYAIGSDLKIELSDPEEGISSALRLGYSFATAKEYFLGSLHEISPELVFSRRLNFAEPYLGFGGRAIYGTISVDFPTPLTTLTLEKSALGFTGYAFTGVQFQILGSKGFRLGIEGTYELSGFHSLGTTFGVGF